MLQEMWIVMKEERDEPWGPRFEICGTEEEAKEYFAHHLKRTDRVEYFKVREVEGTHVVIQSGLEGKDEA